MGAAPGPLHMLFLEVRFFATASVTSHPISVPCPLPAEPSPVCSWGSCMCFAPRPSSLLAAELREEGAPCRAAYAALLPHLPCPYCSHSCGAEKRTDRSCFVLACRVLRVGPASRFLRVCLNELSPAQACCCDPPLVASPALRLRRGPDPSSGVLNHRGCSLFPKHERPRFSSNPGASSGISRTHCKRMLMARLCSWWSGAAVPVSQVWGHLRSGSEEAAPSLSPAWLGALSQMAPGPSA